MKVHNKINTIVVTFSWAKKSGARCLTALERKLLFYVKKIVFCGQIGSSIFLANESDYQDYIGPYDQLKKDKDRKRQRSSFLFGGKECIKFLAAL